MGHDVFISYSSHDKRIADAACVMIERHGLRCWMAPRDILPGREWGEAIIEGIRGARGFVLVFSANANRSPQVNREVERAVSRGLPIVPFRIEDVAPSDSLEYFISNQHWLDALTPPMEQHLTRLADTLRRLLLEPDAAALTTPPGPAIPPGPGRRRGQKLWISSILALAVAAGVMGYWLSRDSPAKPDNAVAAAPGPVATNSQVSRPVPATVPEPLAPLVNVNLIEIGPEGRRDATYYLQSASPEVSNIALTPHSARLVFLYRSSFYPRDALLGGSAPILALEHQGGGTSTVELRFREPVAEVNLRHAGRQRTGWGFVGVAVLYPALRFFAYDNMGRRIGDIALPAWRSDSGSAPMDRWINFRASGSGGIQAIRIIADGVIDYVLPPAQTAIAANGAPPPAPFRAAFALMGLEVRRLPESR